ncbi:MAG: rhodanese-like domain-containing protein [Calditrichaeota bacterium]|nr:rhodanese-like domain-containing protein [Calditrichota bacterium]
MKKSSIFMMLIFGIAAVVVFTTISCAKEKTNVTKEKKSYNKITADELKSMFEKKDFLLVNVHIPYAGEIPQTDLFIPFDQLKEHLDQLPKDKNAKIVLYCRSGHMSAIAAKELTEMGFTNVYDLLGGMKAWAAAGNKILDKSKE